MYRCRLRCRHWQQWWLDGESWSYAPGSRYSQLHTCYRRDTRSTPCQPLSTHLSNSQYQLTFNNKQYQLTINNKQYQLTISTPPQSTLLTPLSTHPTLLPQLLRCKEQTYVRSALAHWFTLARTLHATPLITPPPGNHPTFCIHRSYYPLI